MEKDKGYIKIYRSLFANWLWDNNEPFDKRSAWIDLVKSARYQHESKKELIAGKLIEVKRGQIIASVRFLKERWKWGSNTKVENFLDSLKKDSMISIEKGQGVNIITLLKYDSYNNVEDTERTEKGQREDTERTERGQREDEIKESNNIINKESNKGSMAGVPAPSHIFKLNDNDLKKYNYLKNHIDAGNEVKLLKNQISEKEFYSLISIYSIEEIISAVDNMDNSKTLKGKTSVYLTALKYLKTDSGNKDHIKHQIIFIDRYKKFISEFSKGEITEPRIDNYEKRALHNIMEYLKNNHKDKTFEGALESMNKIFENWELIEPFLQKQTKLEQINRNISNIILQIKQNYGSKNAIGNNKNGNISSQQATGQRKDF